MNAERWQQVDRLLEAALSRAPGERASFIADACKGDEALLSELETLLAAYESAASFLDTPALDLAARQLAAREARALVGQRLGHFQVVAFVGAGGMGEVYRARDTRLGREVAVKLLPTTLATSPEPLRRFEQEARAASALNHPYICGVHDVGETDDGRHFIAMEFVEGETLRERLERGAVPLDEALHIGRQVADALGAAHASGIVHRDVKPENVMLRPDGYVKVLDFGLAKLTEVRPVRPAGEVPAAAIAPVESTAGVVLGTVGYMSPEQATGRRVDARSDVFSLGAVLYELLMGQQAFRRGSTAETLHATVHEEPAGIAALTGAVPAGIAEVVRRCLEKEPDRRYASGADVAEALEAAAVARGPRLRRRWWLMAAAGAVLLAGGAWLRFADPPGNPESRAGAGPPRGPMKVTQLTTVPGAATSPTFSPDGTQIAYSAAAGILNWYQDIFVKRLNDGSVRQLVSSPDSDRAPSWSPDGQSIAFIRRADERSIYTVPVGGGSERKLFTTTMNYPAQFDFVAWSPDGQLIAYADCEAANRPSRIYLLTVATGETRQLTLPPEHHTEWGDLDAAFSPDGQSLAFVRALRPSVADMYVVPVAGGEPRRLTFDNSDVKGLTWTPDGRGIIFSSARGGATTLWRIAAEGGEPEPLDVGGAPASEPAISRDGRRLAYATGTEVTSTWAADLLEGGRKLGPPDRLFTSTSMDRAMRYSPDGTRIAFTSNRSGTFRVWLCDADGSNPRPVPGLDYVVYQPATWSPDGRELAFEAAPDGNADVYVTSVDGGQPRRLTDHAADDLAPTWSRDGRWIYFVSDRTGEQQLWKVSPEGGAVVQVTREGGSPAYESPDGKYLYHQKRAGIGGLWRMPVDGGEEVLVFEEFPPGLWTAWSVTDDGVYYGYVRDRHVIVAFYSFATRKVKQLASFETLVFLTLSPDERQVLYVTLDRSETNVVVVENFRW